jgi:hypothetical protein
MSAIQPNNRSEAMQYLLMIYQNEVEYAKNDAATSQKMLGEYQAFTQATTKPSFPIAHLRNGAREARNLAP